MLILILLIVLIIIIICYLKKTKCSNDSIVYVKEESYPLIGNLIPLLRNRTDYLIKCRQIYGESFKMKLFNKTLIFVLNPSDWTNIIRNPSFVFLGDTFSKTIFDMDHNFFGQSKLDVELQRYFNKYLTNVDGLEKLTENLFNQINFFFLNEKKRSIENKTEWIKSNLFEFSWNLLFNSITKSFYGDIQLDLIKENYRYFDSNIQYLFLLFPQSLYQLFFPDLLKARTHLNEYWLDQIHLPNESEFIRDRTNLMINNIQQFSKKDYSGEKTFLFWSALTNTIPTLFWSLVHILNDQHLFDLVKQEINQNFCLTSLENCQEKEEIHSNNQSILSKLINCIYLESIINESLRLYSNPMIMRRASKDIQFNLKDGRTIDINKNDILSLYPNLAQNDSKYFSNPHQFLFDRFVNKTSDSLNAFLPFGSGKSLCPGRLFAKNAIQISIVFFLQFIQIDLNDFQKIPNEKKRRQGIGVSHPENDITFLFKFK